jgi:hypothetical protein
LIGKASEHWDEEKASRMQKPNLLGNPPVNEVCCGRNVEVGDDERKREFSDIKRNILRSNFTELQRTMNVFDQNIFKTPKFSNRKGTLLILC